MVQMKYLRPMKLYHELLKSNELKRGRLLGLDVGDKYVGLSVSDANNKIASPLRSMLAAFVCFILFHKSCIVCLQMCLCWFMWSGLLLTCSVLVRKKTNIDLISTDFQSLVSVYQFFYFCEGVLSFCLTLLLLSWNFDGKRWIDVLKFFL